MKIEDIEVHVGKPSFSFAPIRLLEAKCEARSNFSSAPSTDDVNGKLRAMAAGLGANAIINVTYDSGISLTSWRSITGRGLAVVRESEEIPCPVCAEGIKRAAVKCRFCGTDISHATPAPASLARPVAIAQREPLRETNNPMLPIILVVIVVVFLMLLASNS